MRRPSGAGGRDLPRPRLRVEGAGKGPPLPRSRGTRRCKALTALFAGLRTIDAPKDADLHQRRVRREREHLADHRSRRDGGGVGRATQRLRAQARLATVRHHQLRRAPINAFGDRQAQGRRPRAAGRRFSRRAVHHRRDGRRAVRDRIASELSGYYLLGVESEGRDKDGKPQPDPHRRSCAKARWFRSPPPVDQRAQRSAGARARLARPRPRRSIRRCWRPRWPRAPRVLRAARARAEQGAAADFTPTSAPTIRPRRSCRLAT